MITSCVCCTSSVKGLSSSDFASLVRFDRIFESRLGDLSGRKTSGTMLHAWLFLALGRRRKAFDVNGPTW